jgi:SAM-dependent methyltransferase
LFEKKYTGDFYDADYFERGRQSGKGWLTNYRWMPIRSFKEALAFVDYFGLDCNSYVLEVGCAKGFIVKALRQLEIKADGCDISNYALFFALEGCWNCSELSSWESHSKSGYTHVIIKDVLEHLTKEQLPEMLNNIAKVCNKIMCVVPMGDNGKYRIDEYHTEISHLIAEDENWWMIHFEKNGWKVIKHCNHVNGLKDNWQDFAYGKGNHVFVLERI